MRGAVLLSGKWEYMSWLLYSFLQSRSVAKRPHRLPRSTALAGVVSGGMLLTSLLGRKKLCTGSSETRVCKEVTRAQSSSPVWPTHSSWPPWGTVSGRLRSWAWSLALACPLGSSLRRSACPRTPSARPSSGILSSHLPGRETVSSLRLPTSPPGEPQTPWKRMEHLWSFQHVYLSWDSQGDA